MTTYAELVERSLRLIRESRRLCDLSGHISALSREQIAASYDLIARTDAQPPEPPWTEPISRAA